MLKHVLDTLDGVPEALKPSYLQQDGDTKWYLQVEGMVAKARLDEFRTNNIELTNKLKSFEGVNPVEYVQMKETLAKGLKPDQAAIDKAVAERVGTMKEEYEGKIVGLSKDNTTMKSQLEVLVVDNAVRAAAVKAGVLPAAVDDVVLRAKTTFKFENGTAVPYDVKGQPLYGKDGANHMTPDEWATSLKRTASHLFPGSTGAGAGGSNGPGGSGGGDPSKMSAMEKINAGLAARQSG